MGKMMTSLTKTTTFDSGFLLFVASICGLIFMAYDFETIMGNATHPLEIQDFIERKCFAIHNETWKTRISRRYFQGI